MRFSKTIDSLQGYLLAASPSMGDDNFAGTVVLLLRHDNDGAFGLVLNRPIERTFKQLWQQLSDKPCPREFPLHFGGPVPGPLLAIHKRRSLRDGDPPAGVSIAANREHLEQLLHQSDQSFRLFVGHAGWGPGQLEDELARGDWLKTPATAQHIFADTANLWGTIVKKIGGEILSSALGIKHVPPDPSMN